VLHRHRRRPQSAATPIEDLSDLAAGDDTAQSAMDTVATRAAVAMIADLPPDQAEAVMLRVVMGLDAENAGRVLGKKAGAVRTAAYRGLRRPARVVSAGRPEPGLLPPRNAAGAGAGPDALLRGHPAGLRGGTTVP